MGTVGEGRGGEFLELQKSSPYILNRCAAYADFWRLNAVFREEIENIFKLQSKLNSIVAVNVARKFGIRYNYYCFFRFVALRSKLIDEVRLILSWASVSQNY